jgi:hypothetical protein
MTSKDFSDTDSSLKEKILGDVSHIKGNFEYVLGKIPFLYEKMREYLVIYCMKRLFLILVIFCTLKGTQD